MEHTVDDVLHKLNIAQLKDLINLFGIEKPHSRSTKSDMLNHIKQSNSTLDAKMLMNYFNIQLKQKKDKRSEEKAGVSHAETTPNGIISDALGDLTSAAEELAETLRSKRGAKKTSPTTPRD
jgi:hypothetical protein